VAALQVRYTYLFAPSAFLTLFACSCRPGDYEIGEPVGFGASSVVHLATFCPQNVTPKPKPLRCAVKIIDVDRMSSVGDIDRLRRCVFLFSTTFSCFLVKTDGDLDTTTERRN
jgi:hypothetical protein